MVSATHQLVDGLRTLAIMPMPRGPREFGNMWPRDVVHDWVDLLAQEDMETDQRELLERAKNRTKLRPSSAEIGRMEQVIAWPGRYLREIPRLIHTVQAVALARARDADIRAAARRLRAHPDLVRSRNSEGLDLIAYGLRRDRIGVF